MSRSLGEITADGLASIDKIFDPLILEIQVYVDRIVAAGQDPARYLFVETDEIVDFSKILAERKAAKQKAVDEFMASLPSDTQGPVPAEEESNIVKALILVAKSVLKDGVRITIGDFHWDSSRPLDGVITSMRDAALDAAGLGENNEFRRFLVDPVQFGRQMGDVITEESERALQNASREATRAARNVERETRQAVENARREAERAVGDIGRAVGRRLPRVRIRKPRWL
jgi:hypothetical protein